MSELRAARRGIVTNSMLLSALRANPPWDSEGGSSHILRNRPVSKPYDRMASAKFLHTYLDCDAVNHCRYVCNDRYFAPPAVQRLERVDVLYASLPYAKREPLVYCS